MHNWLFCHLKVILNVNLNGRTQTCEVWRGKLEKRYIHKYCLQDAFHRLKRCSLVGYLLVKYIYFIFRIQSTNICFYVYHSHWNTVKTIKEPFLSELDTSRTGSYCIKTKHQNISVWRQFKSHWDGERCEVTLMQNVLAEGHAVHADTAAVTSWMSTLGSCLI